MSEIYKQFYFVALYPMHVLKLFQEVRRIKRGHHHQRYRNPLPHLRKKKQLRRRILQGRFRREENLVKKGKWKKQILYLLLRRLSQVKFLCWEEQVGYSKIWEKMHFQILVNILKIIWWNCKQCSSDVTARYDCSFVWVCIACLCDFVSDISV